MVMAETELRWSRITGRTQEISSLKARRAICWAAKIATPLSYEEVGKRICRERSAVWYTFRRAEEERESDPAFKAFTDRLVAAVPDREVPE